MSGRQDRQRAQRLWDLLCKHQEEWNAWHAKAVAHGTATAGPMPALGDKSVASIARALSRARRGGKV